jgi:hypothetical protein
MARYEPYRGADAILMEKPELIINAFTILEKEAPMLIY